VPDPEGDIGVCLIFFLETPELAERFAKALVAENITGTWVLYNSPWHVYDHMISLLEKRTVTKEGCPFNCPCYGRRVEYRKGMLPRTNEILKRAVHMEISPIFSERDVADIIEGIQKVAAGIIE
jgi:dTDP-4-amino-4,6-dideoxygalactose transaminase